MTNKEKILIFLPVMKELEIMGYNPIENMSGEQTMDKLEKRYVALTAAKRKYPKWYKEVSYWVNKLMRAVA